eukprot:TRINITY_DN2144_c0_g1_i1.p1 TRINITY_DN2144_c0_g1~~TRINITY_DN2144_c0_g1_i1.p1  ORF type:complete len:516 (-),score=63.84 TRINITY_DN2144_c0_g1_i1:105-1652(-)
MNTDVHFSSSFLALSTNPYTQYRLNACGSMESKSPPPLHCCKCICSRCCINGHRSIKRKFDEFEDDDRKRLPPSDPYRSAIARVGFESELVALREALISQRLTMHHLFTELEEERSASSTAANEAMSMIQRLQREKAEIQMDDRQFKRFVEGKMEHEWREMLVLEDSLYKRQHVIESLVCQLQAYKHRLMSFGFSEAEVSGGAPPHDRSFSCDDEFHGNLVHEYPSLKCDSNNNGVFTDLKECSRILTENTLNVNDRSDGEPTDVKVLTVCSSNGGDGRWGSGDDMFHRVDAFDSVGDLNEIPIFTDPEESTRNLTENLSNVTDQLDGRYDMFDVVCTINSDCNLSENQVFTDLKVLTQCSLRGDDRSDGGDDVVLRVDAIDSVDMYEMGDGDVEKIHLKIREIEADRESMMQEILSMRTDEAKMILLREIAQHLSKETRNRVNKQSVMGKFSIMSALKWIMSFGFRRKESHQTKYMFGLPGDKVGLLLLLGKSPRYEAATICFKRLRVPRQFPC